MRLAATLVASLAWAACSVAGPAGPTGPLRVELDKSFSLKPGETAQVADTGLKIGFDGVTADSRCPKGVQCFWAGDATVRVWLQQGSEPREVRELHASSAAAQAATALGHELRLLSLDPYPVGDKAIAKSDYVATLTLSRRTATEPDR